MSHITPHRVGLIPAAGKGRRLGSPAQGKEMIIQPLPSGHGRSGPVVNWLLDSYEFADVDEVIVACAPEKQALAGMLTGLESYQPEISVVIVENSPSVPHSVARALQSAGDAQVALGFPDMLFRPRDAIAQLFEALDADFDAVIGLCDADPGTRCDRVETNDDGTLLAVHAKPTDLQHLSSWISAAWRSTFSGYLCDWLENTVAGFAELEMAKVFNAATRDGLRLGAVRISGYRFLDLGTPEGLEASARFLDADR